MVRSFQKILFVIPWKHPTRSAR